MCSIIHERVAQGVEERNLVAEEQGGFSRGRGCRDPSHVVSKETHSNKSLAGHLDLPNKRRGRGGGGG